MEKIKELNYILPWDIKFNNGFVIEHGKTGTFDCYTTTTWTYPLALTTIYSIATSEKLSADTGETTTHISSINKSSVVLYRQFTGSRMGTGYTYIIIIGKK